MFLRHVRIENVRSLEYFEMSCVHEDDSVRRWTLLLGENGCGKSTVLRAIALGMMGSEALSQVIGEPGSWVRQGERSGRISLDLQTEGGDRRSTSLVLRPGMGVSDLLHENMKALRELDAALRHADRNYLTLGYGASRRLSGVEEGAFSKSGRVKDPRARGVATLFSPEAVLDPFEAWVIGLEFESRGSGIKMIRAIDEHLLPDVEFKKIDRKARQLIFDTPDGPTPLSRLSDGYQNVAAWTGDLLRSVTTIFKDYKNPLSARALLLVDEIDLHLHPVWQRRLRSFLEDMFPNLQFVVTTHSPLTAQQSDAGELHVMRRLKPGASPTVERFDGTPKRMMIQQLLASPIFGLGTVDSLEVESKRKQYRELRGKRRLTSTERARRRAVAEELEALPRMATDWGEELGPNQKAMQEILAIVSKKGAKVKAAARPRRTSSKGARR